MPWARGARLAFGALALTIAMAAANLAPGSGVAAADTPVTTPSGSSASVSGPGSPTTITSSGPPPTAAAVTSTTASPPSTTTTSVARAPVTTVDPTVLAALVQTIDTDLARAHAIDEYVAARAVAGQAPTVAGQAPIGSSTTGADDPALVSAAASELATSTARDAAATSFSQARARVAQDAIAVYINNFGTSSARSGAHDGTWSTVLRLVLEEDKSQMNAAQRDLEAVALAYNQSRAVAEGLVTARASSFAASAPVSASPTSVAAARAIATSPATPSSLTTLVASSPTILGPAVLTSDEIAGWYQSTGHQPRITVPLDALVADFESVGASEGVRGDLAFAQSMVETGYLNFPASGQVAVADNNFAGIGACDSCSTGWHFPDAATGVAAQVERLHAYAVKGTASRPLTGLVRVAGCCPTWLALAGVWATNPTYGYAIMKTYRGMIEWALNKRSAEAGL
jgi:hypothetical protein